MDLLRKNRTTIIFILVVSLLSACGGETSSTVKTGDLPFIAGNWKDSNAVLKLCGNQANLSVELALEQIKDNATVTGSSTLFFPSAYLQGGFSGKINARGTVTGKLNFDSGDGPIIFDAKLNYSDASIKGSLNDSETVRCENGSKDQAIVTINLQAPLDDDLEPNNNHEQAAEISSGFVEDLILRDSDWFKFTLSETQIVDVNVSVSPTIIHTIGAQLYNDKRVPAGLVDLDIGAGQFYLPAGTYYLEITGSIDNEEPEYSLGMTATPLPDARFEPNENKDAAAAISLDFVGEMFMSPYDQDWFTFELKDKQTLTFDFGEAGASLKTELHKGEELIFIAYGSSKPAEITLDPGHYQLGLSFFSGESQTYTINIGSANVPDSENEPNDTADEAVNLPIGTLYEGYLAVGDEDWFSFELDSLSSINLYVTNLLERSLTLFDTTLNELTFSDYDEGSYRATLGSGQYYLKLLGPPDLLDKPITFELKVDAQSVPDIAFEPNDSFATAFPIRLADMQTLHLFSGDEDWFRLEFTDKQILSFNSSEVPSIFIRELYNDQQMLLVSAENEGGKGYVVAPGTYYLRVRPRYSDTEGFSYTLETTQKTLPDAHNEPNDSFEQATSVEPDSKTCGLITEGDKDYYSFELDEVRQVIGWTGNDGSTRLFDSSFAYTDLWLELDGFNALLEPGLYYVLPSLPFTKPSASGLDYCLNLSSRAAPTDPYEPDNSVTEATHLSLPFLNNKLFLAENRTSIIEGGVYDTDWFSFDIEVRSILSAVVSGSRRYQTITATLIGQDGFNQTIDSSWDGILEPGDYYLKVSGTYAYPTTEFGRTYSLSLSASPLP